MNDLYLISISFSATLILIAITDIANDKLPCIYHVFTGALLGLNVFFIFTFLMRLF